MSALTVESARMGETDQWWSVTSDVGICTMSDVGMHRMSDENRRGEYGGLGGNSETSVSYLTQSFLGVSSISLAESTTDVLSSCPFVGEPLAKNRGFFCLLLALGFVAFLAALEHFFLRCSGGFQSGRSTTLAW